jgi:glycosyltransferase involved in cell wall biosynthesis
MSGPRARRRVLFLAPYLGDGGINTHMLTLGRELRRLGWDVAICSGGPLPQGAPTSGDGPPPDRHEPLPDDYENAGITHVKVRFPFMPRRLSDAPELLRLPVAAWQVIRTVRRFRPTVVHSHSRQMGVYARVVHLLTGVPFVSTVHSPITPSNRFWSASAFLGSRAMAVSAEIGEGLVRDYRMDPGRVGVVAPGADATHFRPPTAGEREAARRRHGIEEGQFGVAFVGSLTANKRADTLVEAVADLATRSHDVVALIAGKGPEEQAIRERAAELGVDRRVRMLGYQDALGVLWAAEALVLPSRSEGSPLAVVEGMLSGLVVLSTAAGGASQQVSPGRTGFIFEFGDHAGLASAIANLIEQPELRASIGARAREDARERFSSEAMARMVEETYLDALRAASR